MGQTNDATDIILEKWNNVIGALSHCIVISLDMNFFLNQSQSIRPLIQYHAGLSPSQRKLHRLLCTNLKLDRSSKTLPKIWRHD